MSRPDDLLTLIAGMATAEQFRSFLKAHNAPSSGTKEELFERGSAALLAGRFSEDDLLALLRDMEEFGHQHVFLYWRAGRASAVPTPDVLEEWLVRNAAGTVLRRPRLLDLPERPTIVDARYESSDAGNVLVVKVVETRVYEHLVETEEISRDRYKRTYEREAARAVNVIRVRPDGLAEVRLYSHKGGSQRYDDTLDTVWGMLAGLLDRAQFNRAVLSNAKRRLYEERQLLDGVIHFAGDDLGNAGGISCELASGRHTNLFSDPDTERSIAAFTAGGNAFHQSLNLYWLAQKSGTPAKDTHVLLRGEPNEFSVSQRCGAATYEHILNDVLRYNS